MSASVRDIRFCIAEMKGVFVFQVPPFVLVKRLCLLSLWMFAGLLVLWLKGVACFVWWQTGSLMDTEDGLHNNPAATRPPPMLTSCGQLGWHRTCVNPACILKALFPHPTLLLQTERFSCFEHMKQRYHILKTGAASAVWSQKSPDPKCKYIHALACSVMELLAALMQRFVS